MSRGRATPGEDDGDTCELGTPTKCAEMDTAPAKSSAGHHARNNPTNRVLQAARLQDLLFGLANAADPH